MNWGNKILIVIIVFITGMLSMVYVASKQTNEMFDSNYYEKELEYQKFIDAAKNLSVINQTVETSQDANQLYIQLPAITTNNIQDGFIELLKANSKEKDIKLNIKKETSAVIKIAKTQLTKGLYTMRVFWTNAGTNYYYENKSVFINE